VKIGLSSYLLPAKAVEKSELNEILQSVLSGYKQKENHNVSVKVLNCWKCIVFIPIFNHFPFFHSKVSSRCDSCTLGKRQTYICGLCDKKLIISKQVLFR